MSFFRRREKLAFKQQEQRMQEIIEKDKKRKWEEEQEEIKKLPKGKYYAYKKWRQKHPDTPFFKWGEYWTKIVERYYPEDLRRDIVRFNKEVELGEAAWREEGKLMPPSEREEPEYILNRKREVEQKVIEAYEKLSEKKKQL